MEQSISKKNQQRRRRTMRVRAKVRGTAICPRLCVVKSNQHVYAQLIDDDRGVTLVSASSMAGEFRKSEFNKRGRPAATQIGKKIAELAKGLDIQKAVFDRGRFKYHGVLAALADAAREAGLKI